MMVECVGFFSGGEFGVLVNCLWLEGIYGGVWVMCEWWQIGVGVQLVYVIVDVFGVEVINWNLFWSGLGFLFIGGCS